MIKEAHNADKLFIGGNGKLMHWSVSHELTKDYGDIMAGIICSMA
jgi:hypothetical protein